MDAQVTALDKLLAEYARQIIVASKEDGAQFLIEGLVRECAAKAFNAGRESIVEDAAKMIGRKLQPKSAT